MDPAEREARAAHGRDPRVLQANERTLLAWLRTGIGLMAFGFVVARAGPLVEQAAGQVPSEGGAFTWIGAALVLLGAVSSALAGTGYVQVRRALLSGRELRPGAYLPPVVTLLVTLVGVVLAILLVVDAAG